jgi:ADP-heptose synthase, bifunctional sugar kinase/adenylyltransferase
VAATPGLLAEQNIDTSSAIEDERFCTIVKTRIIALHQQVVRVDREKILTPSSAHIAMAVAAVRDSLKETDAIIFEDYGKGFVTTELVAQIARERPRLVR